MNTEKITAMHLELGEFRTGHIFHLLMCIPTMGLWSIMWGIKTFLNCYDRNEIRLRYEQEKEANIVLYVVAFVFFANLLNSMG